jgi:hypothetical protein
MVLPVITTVEADAYFATTPRAAAWAAVAGDPDILLTEAQTWLAALCWDETTDCCGNDFTAAYTRAVSELALALSTNPTALIGTSAASGGSTGPVKRQKLGDLEVEYFQAGSGSSSSAAPGTTKGPLVLRTFPWLRDIIGCWVKNAGSNQLVYRVRS